MRSKQESGGEVAAGCLGFLALLVAGLILRGVTIVTFWGWFVSGPGAAFAGHAPSLNFWQAIGLSIVVTIFVADLDKKTEDNDGGVLAAVITGWSKILVFYGLLWIFALIAHGAL
jgi:hypothetical protein